MHTRIVLQFLHCLFYARFVFHCINFSTFCVCYIADGNTTRNKTRTPNILQNAERPLPSPVVTMKLSESEAPNTSPNTNKTMVSQKLQTLKQRKLELEKQLLEKNTLLQHLCKEEAKLIGCSSFSLNEITNISGVDCSDGGSVADRQSSIINNNSTLTRRHIDTGFKLSENLLISTEDDINQLLLSKQIQQQISQASLRFATDATQTKVSILGKFLGDPKLSEQLFQFLLKIICFVLIIFSSQFDELISIAMMLLSKRSKALITHCEC